MANEKWLKVIDYDAVRDAFDEEYKKTRKLIESGETHLDNLAEGFTEADRVLRKMLIVDAVEVVPAKWILVDKEKGKGVCSNCHRQDSIDPIATHCRFCGAKMDVDGDKDD